LQLDTEKIRAKYNLRKDSRDWKIEWAKKDLKENNKNGKISQIQYRPFDFRYTFYTGKSKGFIGTPGSKIFNHFLSGDNFGLIFSRQFGSHKHFICFITNTLIEISSQPFAPYSVFPLYIYAVSNIDNEVRKISNLNKTIIIEIEKRSGLHFSEEKSVLSETEAEKTKTTFSPIDILDYIYAVLHSPTYRELYKEFLKIDFPRVPYPENAEIFWNLVELGSKLRNLHLLENIEPQEGMADYPIAGNNEVDKPQYLVGVNPCGRTNVGADNYPPLQNARVYINDTQYFDKVPSEAWNFYIGGYQPAQKWLKDRKGRTLNFEDVQHYQKIIRVLKETGEVMKEIEKIKITE